MRRIALVAALAMFPSLVPAGDFEWMVREFSRESGARQVHVPFFGLARFVVAVGRPAGTTDIKLAIFERGELEGLRFSSLTDATVGSFWKPMVRVRSLKGESTNIYVRQDGKNVNLLVAALEGDDATFVQLRIKPEKLIRLVDEHRGHHNISFGD